MFWGETPQLQHCRGGVFIHPVPLSWRKAPGGDKEGVPMVSGCPTASGHPVPHFTAMPAAVSDSRLPQAAATHPRGLLSHSSLFLNQALRGRTAPPCPSAWKWKTHSSTGGVSRNPPAPSGPLLAASPPFFSLPTQAMAMPRAGPKTTGPRGEAVPGAAGAVPVPGAVLVGVRRSGGGAPVGAPWGAEGCPWLSVWGCC